MEKPIKDFRNYIQQLENAGELKRIVEPVHWKYDLGAISRQMQKFGSGSLALLFENIRDYPGHHLLTNGLGSYSRIAIVLGLDRATPFEEIVDIVKERMTQLKPPVLAGDSGIREIVAKGNEVDLHTLPVPWLHEQDGGRYIGTWHLNISKDPEDGTRNIGIYRMQLLSAGTTAISISPGSHLAGHLRRAERKGVALEMAVAIGVDETLIMAAAASAECGTDEYDIAGGLSREPVVLTKCLTVDLEIPAMAEIVLEGRINPHSRVKEGPFHDYAGIAKSDPGAYIFEVSCLTHRKNPIFRGAAIGVPGGEDHVLFSILSSVNSLNFHGSRLRQKIQNALLKKKSYQLFQYVGRLGNLLRQGP